MCIHGSGGDGSDTFQFRSGDGSDIITDFQPGTDTLSFVEITNTGNNLIGGFNIGGEQIGTVRSISFAELAIGGDGTNTTVSFNNELLVTLTGVASLSAANLV
ncbi:MAG: hypothetical protein EAZ61_03570 [Oscillatoriales cyanobacterium]|nr:MAG: hypothetical protein EAZ61_03570 [Oscillatoriales cyanobacterium]